MLTFWTTGEDNLSTPLTRGVFQSITTPATSPSATLDEILACCRDNKVRINANTALLNTILAAVNAISGTSGNRGYIKSRISNQEILNAIHKNNLEIQQYKKELRRIKGDAK